MGKVIRLNESQLKSIIEKIIQEQQFQPSQQYQKGKQSTIDSGKQAQTAVLNAGRMAFKGAKQILVTLGKTVFNVVIYGGAIIFLIGKGIYKVNAAIGNALLKFISSTGKATLAAATAVGDSTITTFKAAGVALEQGAQSVNAFISKKVDQSVIIMKWVLNAFKQFGAAAWGKVLIATGSIRELSSAAGTWLKDSYNTVANAIGVGWDQAMKLGSQGLNAIKQGASTAVTNANNAATKFGNKISSTAANIGNSIANTAGKAAGYIKGFLSEMLERYYSMENYSTTQILSECVKFNGKVIL